VVRNSGSQPDSSGVKPLFTVGHSNLDFPQFVKLLRDSDVKVLIDVRSRPHSSRFPQFSQPGFEKLLGEEGISYLFLGEELGGRPDDADTYRSDGRVDYRKRRKSYAFGAGMERVLAESQHRTCALMCAEEDPLECHRFLMICPELVRMGIQLFHIRKGSKIEGQETAENRLLEANGFGDVAACTLFPQARAEALEEAYELQAGKFAYRVDPLAVDRW
jgi:uncharacterized protein (DUF488 family)